MDSRIDETAIGYPPAASHRLVLFSELVSWCTSELVGVTYGIHQKYFPPTGIYRQMSHWRHSPRFFACGSE